MSVDSASGMWGEIKRRDVLRGIGAASAAGLTGELRLQDGGPDVLNVIGYPESGIQLFRDFYAMETDVDVIVPDGLQDPALPDQVGNDMANVTGTVPGSAGPNRDAFRQLFRDTYNQTPGVFNAHSYDSVAVLILANAAAGENNGPAIRDQMRRVTSSPGDEYGPGEFVEAVEAAANGENVNYQGASAEVEFDQNGDPADAAYDIWEFGGEEGIEVIDTIPFEQEEVQEGQAAQEGPGGLGRTIQVGILLPETGDLGSVGGPMVQAAQLPAQQVNESDVDLQVNVQTEDTQTQREAAISGANALVNAGVPAVCGAASSGNTVPVATEVFVPNQVVGCSPASTAVTITNLADDDFIFRTAPSDILQGQVMAQLAAERVEAQTASTLFVNNDYGQQLSEQFSQTFQEEHGGQVFRQVAFNQGESSYQSVVQQALQPPSN